MQNPIFVIGLPRSGSTLLENSLGESPGVLRLAEMLYLSPWRRDFRHFLRHTIGDLRDGRRLEKMVEILFSKHGGIPGLTGSFWRHSGLKVIGDPMLKANVLAALRQSDRTIGAIFRIVLQEITRHHGRTRCCVAFPVYPTFAEKLFEWFPEASVIFIARDPRGIAMSKTNDPGGTRKYNERFPLLRPVIRKVMMLFVAVQYILVSRTHARLQSHPNYKLVNYEDMIMNPEGVIRQVCDFVHTEFRPEMLSQEAHWAQESSITGKKNENFDPRAAGRWRKGITRFEKWLVTTLTRSSMRRIGFDPETHPIYDVVSAE